MPDAPPTPEVRRLIGATIARVIDDGPALFTELHDAVAATAPDALVADPALADEIERSNIAILAAWLDANARAPGETVEPVLSPDTLDIVRDVARRGLEDSTYNYFRVGQGIAAQHVMQAAFAVSSDAELLRDALDVMLRSASGYIDRSVVALREVIEQERRLRASDGRTRRLDVITPILEGEDTDAARASARLGFELGRPLLACVLWSDANSGAGIEDLEGLARQLAEASGARPPLLVPATATSLWAWIPVAQPVDAGALRAQVERVPGVRVAVGTSGSGVAGFRRGHLDALETQRIMHRLGLRQAVATHAELRVVALAGTDETAARAFITVTLGSLADGPAVLRSTLRTMLAAGFDSKKVARELGLHRNTVLARLRRVQPLLPEGSSERWIDVGLALELDRWLVGEGGREGSLGIVETQAGKRIP